MKKNKKQKIELVVQRYIQCSYNRMTEIISEILCIKKLTEMINLTDESIDKGRKRIFLKL